MFFWAMRRALGETGSRHASSVILSRLSTVRIAFSPALEQLTRYMLFHVFHVAIPLLLGIVDHGGGFLWVMVLYLWYMVILYMLYLMWMTCITLPNIDYLSRLH